MSADSIMDRIAADAGWDVDTQLAWALEYIDNQRDNPTFQEFLEMAKDDPEF